MPAHWREFNGVKTVEEPVEYQLAKHRKSLRGVPPKGDAYLDIRLKVACPFTSKAAKSKCTALYALDMCWTDLRDLSLTQIPFRVRGRCPQKQTGVPSFSPEPPAVPPCVHRSDVPTPMKGCVAHLPIATPVVHVEAPARVGCVVTHEAARTTVESVTAAPEARGADARPPCRALGAAGGANPVDATKLQLASTLTGISPRRR